MTVGVELGHTLLLEGPAQVKILRGNAECFGAPIRQETWVDLEDHRQEPFLARDRCVFEVKTDVDGSWKVLDESTIPKGWEEAAHVLQRQQGTAVIVGEVDSGKSSLCCFLANMCRQDGLQVAVIDTDVGQADIGPPTTINSSHFREPVLSLQDLKPEVSFFAGDTSPSTITSKLIALTVRLKNSLAKAADVLIVNSDGWIGDPPARRFKENLLDEIKPDIVLGLSREREIDPLLDMIHFTSLRLSRSKYARSRSKDERKSSREAGYRRFLLGSKLARVSQETTSLRLFDQPSQVILQWERKFKGFLAGLLDQDGQLLAIGRIRDISDGKALVETTTAERPRFLEIGNVALSSSYEEMVLGTLH